VTVRFVAGAALLLANLCVAQTLPKPNGIVCPVSAVQFRPDEDIDG